MSVSWMPYAPEGATGVKKNGNESLGFIKCWKFLSN
jgi:hypothetical protein